MPPTNDDSTTAKLRAIGDGTAGSCISFWIEPNLPGKVDGLCGEFTVKAVERWIAAHPGESLETLIATAGSEISQIHSTQQIPASAAKHIGVIPADNKARAACKYLPYESLMEYMAERFHTDLNTLRRLNPDRDLTTLKIGDSVQVPNRTSLPHRSLATCHLHQKQASGPQPAHLAS